MSAIEILHRSDSWLAVNKPTGMNVYESSYTGPCEATLLGLLRSQLGIARLHAIHRLDHATSGVLLVATDARAAAMLSGRFESREVDKRYMAIVRGEPAEEFVVEVPLTGAEGRGEPKAARTLFTTLARLRLPIPLLHHPEARYAWVEARPQTGRYHQIRRHLKHAAHPIVGDVKYGKGEHNRLFRQHFGIHRLLLHARYLGFDDPISGERVEIWAEYDAPFQKALDLFGQSPADGPTQEHEG